MPRDELYVERNNNFGHELYGDSLYVPEEKEVPKDYTLYNQEELAEDGICPNDAFSAIKEDKYFENFTTIPYLTFNALNDAFPNDVYAKESPYVLVEKGWDKKLWNPSLHVIVKVFIPLEEMNLSGFNDARIINKVILNNHSNPTICHQVTGTFRSPVAITRNPNHYRFDSNNCDIYNDWFVITMSMPASYLTRK